MNLDTPLRKVAKTVLAKFGTSVTIRYKTGTAYNTTTRTMTPTTSDTVGKGRLDKFHDRELSDTVLASDRKLTVAAADFAKPSPEKDSVFIAGLEYQIVGPDGVQSLIATDLAAVYILQLRR